MRNFSHMTEKKMAIFLSKISNNSSFIEDKTNRFIHMTFEAENSGNFTALTSGDTSAMKKELNDKKVQNILPIDNFARLFREHFSNLDVTFLA